MKGHFLFKNLVVWRIWNHQRFQGLSIPYNFYNGALKSDKNLSGSAKASNETLAKFLDYLRSMDTSLVTFNLKALAKDISMDVF